MKVEIQGIDQLRAQLSMLSDRRFAAGIATALTRTAKDVQADTKAAMSRVFDRPTPWTLNSTRIQSASADRLEAGMLSRGK